MAWSAKTVGHAVLHHIMDKAAIVVPNCNYTGYEADLLVVPSNRKFVDVEIKIDRSDLKADMKKDKWWVRSWRKEEVRREFAPDIWKHYFVMPAKVWDDKLLGDIPATSGVITIDSYPHTGSKVRAKVVKVAKPNRAAKTVTPEECFALGRLCNLRMWDRFMAIQQGERRLGEVKISAEYMRRIRDGEKPDPLIVELFKETVTLDIRRDFLQDDAVYLMASDRFDPLPPGAVVPTYVAMHTPKGLVFSKEI